MVRNTSSCARTRFSGCSKMHKWLGCLLLAAAALGTASAQLKVAIMNPQEAVAGTAEFKKWNADIEARIKPRQDKRLKLQKDIQDIQAQIQGGKLNDQAAEALRLQGQQKQRQGT